MTADLLPTVVDAPAAGSVDEAIVVTTQVENLGASESGDYRAQYRLSLDATIDNTDRVIMTVTRPTIGPNGIDAWEQAIPIPETVPQGEFFVGITIDPLNEIAETDESNNTLVGARTTQLLKGLPISECDTFGPSGTTYRPGVNCRTIDVDGYRRTYIAYIPNDVMESGKDPVSSVTMFHGGGGHGKKFLNISGWREKADDEGFVAVFPTSAMYCEVGRPCENGRLSGWSTSWSHGDLVASPDLNFDQRPPGYPAEAPWPADDVQFVGDMLDELESSLPLDTNRTYVSGFSSGAQFGRRLLFDMPQRLAAVAIVGGGLDAGRDPDVPPSPVLPLYLAVGAEDDKVLRTYGLSEDDTLPLDPSEIISIMGDTLVEGTLNALQLAHDPNQLRPTRVHREPVTTRLTWDEPLPGNETGNAFHLTVWADLAHKYPSEPSVADNPNGFSAADTFWTFFERHAKQSPADFNGDAVVDDRDIDLLFDAIHSGSGESVYDLDGSSSVDRLDVAYLVESVLNTRAGDANLDGTIDSSDLNRVGINWRRDCCVGWADGDFNGDDRVDASDLNKVGLHWQMSGARAMTSVTRDPRAPLSQPVLPPSPAIASNANQSPSTPAPRVSNDRTEQTEPEAVHEGRVLATQVPRGDSPNQVRAKGLMRRLTPLTGKDLNPAVLDRVLGGV